MNIPIPAAIKSTLTMGVVFFVLFALACGGSGSSPPSGPAPTLTAPPPPTVTVTPATIPATPGLTPTPGDPSGDLVAAGRALFTGGGGCLACHTIDGVAQGVLGPNQTHVGTWAGNRIPGYTPQQYIRESIAEPCAYNVSPADEGIDAEYDCNLMEAVVPTLGLSDADVDALVAFLMAQK